MAGPVINAKLLADVSDFTSGMSKAGKSLQAMGKSMLGISTKAFALSAALTAVGGVAVRTFAEFENRMASVGVISGATGLQFALLEESARSLGASTLFTARQAADGMEILAKAGFSVNEIMSATPDVLNLATAASLELGEAADIVIGIMRGYGKSAEELADVNDVLVKTFTSTNVTVGDIGQTMGLVGPIARTVGIEFEELSAVIGILGNSGIKGTRAGTALRKALISFSAPTPKASRAFKRLGLEVLDAAGNMRPLNEIIDQFSGEDGPALIKSISEIIGVRPAAAFAALANSGGASIRKLTKELRNAEGTAKEVSDVMTNTLSGQFTILKSKIEAVAISLGKRLAPMMREIVARAQRFVDTIMAISSSTKNTVLRIAALTAGISAAVGVFTLVAGAALLLAGALLLLLPPIAVVVLLITMAGALRIAWEKNIGKIKEAFSGLKDFVKTLLEDIGGILATTVNFWKKQVRKLADFFQKPIPIQVPVKIQGDAEAMEVIRALLAQGFKGQKLETQIKSILKLNADDFRDASTVWIKPMSSLQQSMDTLAAARGEDSAPAGAEFDTSFGKSFAEAFSGDEIKTQLGKSFKEGLGVLSDLVPPGMKNKLRAIKDELAGLVGKIGQGVGKIDTDVAKLLESGREVSISMSNWADAADTLIDSIKNFGRAALDFASKVSTVAGPMLKSAITGLAGKVLSGAEKGFEQGGPQGAVIGAVAALLLSSKTFTDLLNIVNVHLQFVADTLGMFLEPLRPLVAIVGLFMRALLIAAPSMILLGIALDLLTPLFRAIFEVVKFFGLIILKVGRFFLKLLGKSTKKVNEQIEELENTAFDTAGQIDDLGDSAAAAAEALFNVPAGFKVAAARFRAQQGEIPGREGTSPSGGGSGDPTGGSPFLTPTFLPHLKRALKFGGEGEEAVGSSEGAATSGGITIENLTIVADDPDEFLRKLERKAFQRRGIPVAGANQFATGRGS